MVTGRKLRAAREAAAAVPDPELPMMTLADLGILRDVTAEGDAVVVTITPTYSGCPAMREIAHDLRVRLGRAGFADVTVRTALAPPWTSDWITAEGRRKLRDCGHRAARARSRRAAARCRSRSARPAGSRWPAPGAAPPTPPRPRRSAGPPARRCTGARPAASPSST